MRQVQRDDQSTSQGKSTTAQHLSTRVQYPHVQRPSVVKMRPVAPTTRSTPPQAIQRNSPRPYDAPPGHAMALAQQLRAVQWQRQKAAQQRQAVSTPPIRPQLQVSPPRLNAVTKPTAVNSQPVQLNSNEWMRSVVKVLQWSELQAKVEANRRIYDASRKLQDIVSSQSPELELETDSEGASELSDCSLTHAGSFEVDAPPVDLQSRPANPLPHDFARLCDPRPFRIEQRVSAVRSSVTTSSAGLKRQLEDETLAASAKRQRFNSPEHRQLQLLPAIVLRPASSRSEPSPALMVAQSPISVDLVISPASTALTSLATDCQAE